MYIRLHTDSASYHGHDVHLQCASSSINVIMTFAVQIHVCQLSIARYMYHLKTVFLCGAVFDATGQEESGKASGNLVSEGQYEQCRDVRKYTDGDDAVQSQYCLAWWYGALV